MLGSPLSVVTSPAATASVEMGLLLQQAAQTAGLKIELKQVPADGYWSNYWMKVPVGYGNINPRPTADILLSLFFHSGAAWNESAWKNVSNTFDCSSLGMPMPLSSTWIWK